MQVKIFVSDYSNVWKTTKRPVNDFEKCTYILSNQSQVRIMCSRQIFFKICIYAFLRFQSILINVCCLFKEIVQYCTKKSVRAGLLKMMFHACS